MSGPKISIYELSAWQRQNLSEQLKCSQQSFVCAEQIKQLIFRLSGLGGQIESLLDTISLVNARTGDCSAEINELRHLQTSLKQDCFLFTDKLSANKPILSDRIRFSDAALNEKKILLGKLKSIKAEVIATQKKIELALSEMNVKSQLNINEIKSSITDDVADVSSFYIEQAENEHEQFAISRKKLEDKLHALFVSSECPVNIKSELWKALSSLSQITNAKYLDTFNAVTIKPLLKKGEELLAWQREQQELFLELKEQYSSLCAIAQTHEKFFPPDSKGIESLNLEISALEKQIAGQTEQKYITNCVNEVMTEMGYDLIGNRSVTKRSRKQFRNEIFSYGDGTAINVTYDSEGQIAMELGGIDRTDRIPTSDETAALCEDMESFCTDFRIFEEKLKSRGVSIKSRVSISPPAAEYAAIINVADYNITAAKPIANMSVKSKRKKSASRQIHRKEDN